MCIRDSRPLVRIVVSEQVREAVAPHVNLRLPMYTVIEGHDVDYFSSGRPARIEAIPRVLYSTWKSDLGDRVAELVDPSIATFTAIREPIDWPTLRNHYHHADIFLGTPGPEEGFYLPGLEAMASGCAVVMSLVGGNAAYGVPGVNMIECAYDDEEAHASIVRYLATNDGRRNSLIDAGRDYASLYQIENEERPQAMEIIASPLGNYDGGLSPEESERSSHVDT